MKKCCCSCTHNIRQTDDNKIIHYYCEIDGHYIGYVACFENVCDKYEKEVRERTKERNGVSE